MAGEALTVLIVGGGGREHAIAWRLHRDNPTLQLIAAPGNPGIATHAECVPVSATDVDGLLALARDRRVALTIVGPEAPLALGLADRFRDAGLPVFGPTQAAARIETSKAFSKDLMRRAGVPTARATICASVGEAERAIDELTGGRADMPIVMKASGLAAGKGVVVCDSAEQARHVAADMLEHNAFGDAGHTVLVEEFMRGEELSLFVVTDGTRAVPLVPAQDHKRLLAGDRGPNTGGMGAYAPVSLAMRDPALLGVVMDRVIEPTLAGMREAGAPFTGLLYAGLMMTDDGPQVVEFNCRFGDPETEAILPVLDAHPSLLELMLTVARDEPLPGGCVVRASGSAVTTVLASAGYPERARTGDAITLPEPPGDVLVFHAGTRRDESGSLVTSGGRVLAITGLGESVALARDRGVAYSERVEFAGKQFRSDIAWRELSERAGAS
jgi:phosphoribosylamine---glycine ligase